MATQVKFLHCMRKAEYLESAINNGLMFTAHDVTFKLSDIHKDHQVLLNQLLPVIDWRLKDLNTNFAALTEERKNIICLGIGGINGKIPMLCFTEVPEGKYIEQHSVNFGVYSLIISRKWIEKNGGDRVVYIGDNAGFSQLFAQLLGAFRALTLKKDDNGLILFEGYFTKIVLDIFCFCEARRYLEEQEWRIAGNHGFLGGGNSTGSKLPLPINDIEYVFVKEDSEIEHFKAILQEKAKNEGGKGKVPDVLVCPQQIPL